MKMKTNVLKMMLAIGFSSITMMNAQAQDFGGHNGSGCPPIAKSVIEIKAILDSDKIGKRLGFAAYFSSSIKSITLKAAGDPAVYIVEMATSDNSVTNLLEVTVSGASSGYVDSGRVTSVKKVK
jgi:hypothetical protein